MEGGQGRSQQVESRGQRKGRSLVVIAEHGLEAVCELRGINVIEHRA